MPLISGVVVSTFYMPRSCPADRPLSHSAADDEAEEREVELLL
jgi:hypothetical protein